MNDKQIIEKIAILYSDPWSIESYYPEKVLGWENEDAEYSHTYIRDVKNVLEAALVLGYALTPIIKPHS